MQGAVALAVSAGLLLEWLLVRAPTVESHGLSAHPTLLFALQATDNLFNGDGSGSINPVFCQVLHGNHLVQVLALSGGLIKKMVIVVTIIISSQ